MFRVIDIFAISATMVEIEHKDERRRRVIFLKAVESRSTLDEHTERGKEVPCIENCK